MTTGGIGKRASAHQLGVGAQRVLQSHPWLWQRAEVLVAFAHHGHGLAIAPGTTAQRCAKLDRYESELLDAFHGQAKQPMFVRLAATVRRHEIPITPLTDLVMSFRIEAAAIEFRDFSTLEDYCRLSAASAGRLILRVAGEQRLACIARCDELAVAVRLVDMIVDLGRDARRGRVWVPRSELRAFGVDTHDLISGDGPECEELVAFLVARARAWLARARPLERHTQGALRGVLATIHEGSRRRLDDIERRALDPFAAQGEGQDTSYFTHRRSDASCCWSAEAMSSESCCGAGMVMRIA
ncbi:MAG: squalene/phytoene synthase family protein [Nannocystaceae bacterium]|nr:squalene/phytoene synthase family protein [Nannocystaceae bacterium]